MLDDAEILRDLAYFTRRGTLAWKRRSEENDYYASFGGRVGLHLFKSAGKWFLNVYSEGRRDDVLCESDHLLEFKNLVNAVEKSRSCSALDVLRREIFSSYYASKRRVK